MAVIPTFAANDVLTAANMNLVAYAAQQGSRNAIINGAMDIWQRGTSIAISTDAGFYTSDRFQVYGATVPTTTSRQVTGDTTNLPSIEYCARVQKNSGSAVNADIRITTTLETKDSLQFAGKTVTLSFYARKGANFSAASNLLRSVVSTGTGTDQNILTGFTGQVNLPQDNTLTGTWQRFTQTVSVGSTVTQIGLRIVYLPTGTAGANDYFEITGVQLEAGSVATPFKRNAPSIQAELAACQRYYQRINASDGGVNSMFANGFVRSSTQAFGSLVLPVRMRVTPTAIESSTVAFNSYNGASSAMTSLTLDTAICNPASVQFYGTITGGTAGFIGIVNANGSSSAYLAFNAEV